MIRPVDGLPALRDADINVHIVGRDAVVSIGKATADLPSGRKLVFRPACSKCPTRRRTRRRRACISSWTGRCRPPPSCCAWIACATSSDAPFDPVDDARQLERAGHARHAAEGRSAAGIDQLRDRGRSHEFFRRPHDHGAEGRRGAVAGDRHAARLPAQGRRQDRRHAGQSRIPQIARRADAEVRICRACSTRRRGTIWASIWARRSAATFPSGFPAVSPSTSDREGRFNVEADLTSAQIDGLLPGWAKPSGKPARATFTLTTKPQSIRIEDLLIEGSGGGVKGTIDFDGSRRSAIGEFPDLRLFRRRPRQPQDRARAGRRAARDHARRSLRRARLRQDRRRRPRPPNPMPNAGRSMSIST